VLLRFQYGWQSRGKSPFNLQLAKKQLSGYAWRNHELVATRVAEVSEAETCCKQRLNVVHTSADSHPHTMFAPEPTSRIRHNNHPPPFRSSHHPRCRPWQNSLKLHREPQLWFGRANAATNRPQNRPTAHWQRPPKSPNRPTFEPKQAVLRQAAAGRRTLFWCSQPTCPSLPKRLRTTNTRQTPGKWAGCNAPPY
jgi:hypothetical protein